MNAKILLFAVSIAAFSSCSTAYRSTQTPDDVYFSPNRFYDEEKNDDRDQVKKDNYEDREIRMRITDYRWRNLDYDYSYNPYHYGYNYGYYYNPYYCSQPVYIPGKITVLNPVNSTPRTTNLGGYGTGYNYTNTANVKTGLSSNPVRNYNTGRSNTKRYSNDNNTPTRNSSSDDTRSYTPSSNSSSNSSSGNSSSSGGTISRPARNGN